MHQAYKLTIRNIILTYTIFHLLLEILDKKNVKLKPFISVEQFAHIWLYDVQNGLEKNSASHPIMFFITSRHSFEF